jgi:DNA-binding HxlR family transcriptional regulator
MNLRTAMSVLAVPRPFGYRYLMKKPPARAAAQFDCPVEGFQTLISGKYRLRILWELKSGPLRYGELKAALAASMGNTTIAARVLSRDLKELLARAMIVRHDCGTVPLHVEYSLSEVGRTFIPVLGSIHRWGVKHLVRQSVLNAVARKKEVA